MLDRNILNQNEVVGPIAEIKQPPHRGLFKHCTSGDVPNGINGNPARKEKPMAHQSADVWRNASMRLLCHKDGEPPLVVRRNVPTDSVSELPLRRASLLAQAPREIIDDQSRPAWSPCEIIQCGKVIQAGDLVQQPVLSLARGLIVRRHQIDVFERGPGVAVTQRAEQSICFSATHSANECAAARIRQDEAVAAFIWRTMRALLGILEPDDSSWVARFVRRICLLFHPLL